MTCLSIIGIDISYSTAPEPQKQQEWASRRKRSVIQILKHTLAKANSTLQVRPQPCSSAGMTERTLAARVSELQWVYLGCRWSTTAGNSYGVLFASR